MKKIINILGILFCLQSTTIAQNYHIQGKIEGGTVSTVYLCETNKSVFDSAQVKNGTFTFEKPINRIRQVAMQIGRSKQLFLLEDHPLQVTFKVNKTIRNLITGSFEMKGSENQRLLGMMNKALGNEMMTSLGIALMGQKAQTDQQLRDSLGNMYIKAKANTKAVFDTIVSQHHDSYVSALIIKDFYSKEKDYDATRMLQLYGDLSPQVRASSIGKELKATIEKMQVTGIGQMAPEFHLQTPEGKSVSLSSLRGHYVLIDFWASWCGPCIREIPNVKKTYERFHSEGFEILSVSLDNKSENWENAIRKHGLNWNHVSSLKGWKCPVAKLYHVSAVPAMFLIGPDGRIIDNNVSGATLEKTVEKLYTK